MAQGMDLATLGESDLDALIVRASRMFDQQCGVADEYFEAAEDTASNRTFYGNGTNFLRVGPYVAGSLNTTLTYPDGYTDLEFIEKDDYLVRVDSSGVRLATHSCGGWYENVPIIVSARWGYESTPEDVKAAIIELVINLWRETDPAMLKLVSIDNQPLREKLPPRVAEIARKRRVQVGVLI